MDLLETMNCMEIRMIMKGKGWDSNDSITQTGWKNGYGYSIWFERWDWHGISIGEVCLHSHTNNLSEIDNLVYKLAIKSLKAWDDFQDSVPHQMADNSLKPDPIQTPFFKRAKINGEINESEQEELFNKLIQQIGNK
jgi:hypothetical protein